MLHLFSRRFFLFQLNFLFCIGAQNEFIAAAIRYKKSLVILFFPSRFLEFKESTSLATIQDIVYIYFLRQIKQEKKSFKVVESDAIELVAGSYPCSGDNTCHCQTYKNVNTCPTYSKSCKKLQNTNKEDNCCCQTTHIKPYQAHVNLVFFL